MCRVKSLRTRGIREIKVPKVRADEFKISIKPQSMGFTWHDEIFKPLTCQRGKAESLSSNKKNPTTNQNPLDRTLRPSPAVLSM